MIKKIVFLLLFALYFSVNAQSKIYISDIETLLPLQNAAVSCKGKVLGRSNTKGELSINTKCKSVEITAVGYYNETEKVLPKMEVLLRKIDAKSKNIEGVIIKDRSDPRALEILKKVTERYQENSPKSLDTYQFRSYEKIALDFDEDSIQSYNAFVEKRMDSLKKMPITTQKKKDIKDSLAGINIMKMIGKSQLFLWEKASEYKYSKKLGEKVTILDNKISGLKDPVFELMAFRSNRNQIPKEIAEENRNLFRYFLTDSVEIEGRKNYVIRFRPLDNNRLKRKRKYTGALYIDQETYALKQIISNSKAKNEGQITSIWTPIDGKWFLAKERYKFKVGSIGFSQNSGKKKLSKEEKKNIEKFGNYVFVKTDYFDFKTNTEINKKDFRGYSMDIKSTDGSLLEKYRTTPLSERETNTYTQIDSLGEKYNINNKAKMFSALLKGKLHLGMVDFDITKIFSYNKYEKFRLGISAKLNDKFSKYLSPDAFLAYGFGDENWKYGAGLDIRTTLQKNSFFRIEYFDDIMMAGRFSENQWNYRMNIMNSGVALYNDVFYQFKGGKLSYENDITNGLTLQVFTKKTEETAKFSYQFKNLGNQFMFTTAGLGIKYSPRSKNIMTPNGKYTYEEKLPDYYLNYEQGFSTLGGQITFSKIDALFVEDFKSKLGTTGIRLFGGMVFGEVPIWKTFSMNGLGSSGSDLHFNLTSYLGFATMEAGTYFNDHFVGTYISHQIPWYFKSFGGNTSSFDLVYRGTIGNMKNPQLHQFEFKKLDHLYNEVGLEWNNFLSSQFNLGLFYRVGYYQTPKFKDNFAIQFKLKLLGF